MDPAQKVELHAYSRQTEMNAVIGKFSSPVQQFYSGVTVFITGGSGFMGKQLIEKLFRACKLKKVYLLMRKKKGKAIEERLEVLLTDPIFDGLHKTQPDFVSKLVPVEGDVIEQKLGICQEHWDILTKEVNVIFHLAATIRFDEPLRVATIINVRGTREAILLGRQCTNLKKFVHVSTAYTQATTNRRGQKIYEEFYSVPVPPDVMISLAETVQDFRLNDITTSLINEWPNTYTFTKAIAEDLVRTAGGDLPICIVRPAIVIASYTEPCPGWMDLSCVFGPSGIVFGSGIGALRTFLVDVNTLLSLVPVDYVTNAIIASAWDSSKRQEEGEKVPIYTVANEEAGIQWKFISQSLYTDEFYRLVSPKTIWYTYIIETNNKLLFWLLTWLQHYIPAYIGDAIVSVFKIKMPQGVPSFVKLYDKVAKFTAIYNCFLTNEFVFQDHNVKGMLARMCDEDRAIFNCDLATVDKKEFIKMWCIGIRKYIVKDGLTGSVKAYKRQFYFKIAHFTIIFLFMLIFYKLFMFIYHVTLFVYDIL